MRQTFSTEDVSERLTDLHMKENSFDQVKPLGKKNPGFLKWGTKYKVAETEENIWTNVIGLLLSPR